MHLLRVISESETPDKEFSEHVSVYVTSILKTFPC